MNYFLKLFVFVIRICSYSVTFELFLFVFDTNVLKLLNETQDPQPWHDFLLRISSFLVWNG